MTIDYAAMDIAEDRRKAMAAIHRKPKQTRRAFLLGQASDPVLAAACAPYQSTIRPVVAARKRRR